MITVTRRGGGPSFALNPDLIERLEQTSDADGTVITLVSGTQYVVADTVEQIVAEVRRFRAAVLTATFVIFPLMGLGVTKLPFLPAIAVRKAARGWLDFDDLILKTRALLDDPAVGDWVLWKLDGGIDHILVDEAQDTSPRQWPRSFRLRHIWA